MRQMGTEYLIPGRQRLTLNAILNQRSQDVLTANNPDIQDFYQFTREDGCVTGGQIRDIPIAI